jgi:hypothetical protein
MVLYIHFILLNFDYNQSIADDYNDGDESPDNVKHLWEDEFKVSEPVNEFKIKHKENYALKGFFSDDKPFDFEISNISMVDCTTINGVNQQFAISKKLIKSIDKHIDEKNQSTHITFYLHDNYPFQNPIDGVYIIDKDFPNELKK